jgi:hypothetical protein
MSRTQIEARVADLDRRVLDGSDDREYCLKWIGIHHKILEAMTTAGH